MPASMLRRALPYALSVAASALTLWLLFGDYSTFTRGMDFNEEPLEDFMGPYLETGRTVLREGAPVEGFLYPPSFAVALVPLARLDPGVASWVWTGLVLAAIGALLALGLLLVRPPPRVGALALYLGLTAVPLAHNLHWGQVGAMIGALVLLAAWADRAGHRELALVPLALAAGIKLFPAAFLAVCVARGEWARALRGLALAAAVVLGLPMLVLGPETTLSFARAVGEELAARRDAYFHAPNAQAFGPVLARWTGVDWPIVFWVAGLVLAIAQLPLLWRVAHEPLFAYAVVAATLPLVVEPHWPHYFVFLPFLQLLALADPRRDRIAQGLALVSAALTSLVLFRMLGAEVHGRAGLLLVADLALLAGLRRLR